MRMSTSWLLSLIPFLQRISYLAWLIEFIHATQLKDRLSVFITWIGRFIFYLIFFVNKIKILLCTRYQKGTTQIQSSYMSIKWLMIILKSHISLMSWPNKIKSKVWIHLSLIFVKLIFIPSKPLQFLSFHTT